MRNVDLLTNEKLKAQLTLSDIEINRDLFLKRKELQKTNPAITDEEVKEVLRKEYLEKLQSLMNEAILAEVAQIKAGNTTALKLSYIETPVQKLKKEIYKAYLRQSQDFTESIYKN